MYTKSLVILFAIIFAKTFSLKEKNKRVKYLPLLLKKSTSLLFVKNLQKSETVGSVTNVPFLVFNVFCFTKQYCN